MKGISLKALALAITCLVIIQCFHTESQDPKNKLSEADQEKLDEYATEVDVGRNMAGRLLQFYGVYDDSRLIRYVNQLGNYVAKYSDAPDRRYMFNVLDTEAINAFACPGGYILITLGTIKNVKNEAELAMILGHEITHVAKKHMFNAIKKMDGKEREAAAKHSDDANILIDDIQEVRKRPDPEESKIAAELVKYVKGATGGSLNFLEAAKAGMTLILEKGIDHELEFEADDEGVKIAIKAGYEPTSLREFLKRVGELKKKEKGKFKQLEKTHPKIEERLTRIDEVLKKLNVQDVVGATGEDRFHNAFKNAN